MNERQKQEDINEREWRLLYNWSGPFGSYSSKSDTRLWVPRRPGTGTGYTLNLGQPGAKAALGAIFVGPVLVVAVLVILYFSR